jgi:hypothetical protein
MSAWNHISEFTSAFSSKDLEKLIDNDEYTALKTQTKSSAAVSFYNIDDSESMKKAKQLINLLKSENGVKGASSSGKSATCTGYFCNWCFLTVSGNIKRLNTHLTLKCPNTPQVEL